MCIRDRHKKISETKTYRGLNRDGIIAASIYIACRINNYPRTAKEIANIFNIGDNGIRSLLKREGIDTGLNKNKLKYDRIKIKERYLILLNENKKKKEIYDIITKEFNLKDRYSISKCVR